MKERPILFSAPMVRAILEGRKTQTRRIMKRQPYTLRTEGFGYPTKAGGFVSLQSPHCLAECPYGKPGDRLWVRESFQPLLADDLTRYKPDYKTGTGYKISYPATDGIVEFYDMATDNAFCSKMTPSIFMPRWASRITLEITDVRVQRLQEISGEDAASEGVTVEGFWSADFAVDPRRIEFMKLWTSINGEGSWLNNPWIWAITFKRVEAGERAA